MKKIILYSVFAAVLITAGTGALHADKYPESIRTGFMDGCTVAGGYYTYCMCALETFETKYSLPEFIAFEKRMSKGELTDKELDFVTNMSLKCLSK